MDPVKFPMGDRVRWRDLDHLSKSPVTVTDCAVDEGLEVKAEERVARERDKVETC